MNTDKKRRYTKVSNDKTDRKALIRSAVEWFAFVLVVMAAALILLNSAFEVCEIDLNGKKTDVFVSKVGYTVERGDAVALEKNCVYVIACEGEGLPLNSDGRPAIESVLYQNRLYGQDEISELLAVELRLSVLLRLILKNIKIFLKVIYSIPHGNIEIIISIITIITHII